MPGIDMGLEELERYAPAAWVPADLGEYWSRTLRSALDQPLEVEERPYPLALSGVECRSLTFAGYEGGRIAARELRPAGPGPYPGVVVFHGYSGSSPSPLELYPLAAQGVAVLAMDCRGQNGESGDDLARGSGHLAGWMTQGIRDPERYYYRHVYSDAVRAVEVLAARPGVDPARLAVTGVSQGGGLSLAVAALSGRICFAWADIPFLCDIRRGVEIAQDGPYLEIAEFLRRWPRLEPQVWRTLGYVDVLGLADRITCPVVVTVALWDDICPPSTVFGAFRRISSEEKELRRLPYHGHDLPEEVAEQRLVTLLSRLAAGGTAPRAGAQG